MLIGYARVSKADGSQTLDLQRDALRAAGVRPEQMYEDFASGMKDDRPGLLACLKALREGDTLVVWRLDRLGRSLPDLVRIVGELEQKGVSFESLTEKIETGSAAGKLVFHVFAALAEFERNLIRERTRAGLVAARARGRAGGRKPKLTDAQIKEINEMVDAQKLPIGRIAELYGVSRTTIYKVAPRRENEAGEAQPMKKKP